MTLTIHSLRFPGSPNGGSLLALAPFAGGRVLEATDDRGDVHRYAGVVGDGVRVRVPAGAEVVDSDFLGCLLRWEVGGVVQEAGVLDVLRFALSKTNGFEVMA
jgi:hypothetical protein